MIARWIVKYEGEPGWSVLSALTSAAAVEKYVSEDSDCPHDLAVGVVVCVRPDADELADWFRFRVSRQVSPLLVERAAEVASA
jgi:hypothetical protein